MGSAARERLAAMSAHAAMSVDYIETIDIDSLDACQPSSSL